MAAGRYRSEIPGWPLALFRIAFGGLYVDMAIQKAPWVDYGWLRGFIDQEIANPAVPSVAAFLEQVVIPNFAFFGMVTFVVELGLGVGLLLGALTRLVALAGFLWQVNIALQAFNVPGEWYWIWPLLTLPQFCFFASGAGRVLGLDRWLGPALQRRATAGSRWARSLRLAT